MSPKSSRSGSARPGLLSRLWQVFAPPPPQETVIGPPLFPPRPLPPPEPRGPGLPAMDEILREAPPPPDPQRQPRLTLVDHAWPEPAPEPTPTPEPIATPVPEPAPVAEAAPPAPEPAPPEPDLEPVAAQVRALIAAGQAAEAMALLDAHFKHRPTLANRAGLPWYPLLGYPCAVALNDLPAAAGFAATLRPLLDAHDPLLELVIARSAARAGNFPMARAAWMAVLHRAPGWPEATDWLARHPMSPDGGVPVTELLADPPPMLSALPPLLALTSLPESLPAAGPAQWLRNVAIRNVAGAPATDGVWDDARDPPALAENDVALVLRDPDDIARPAHFAETALAAFALARGGPAPLRMARLYAGRQPWASRAGDAMQAELLAILFPGLRVTAGFDGAIRERAVMAIGGAGRDPGTASLIGGIMPQLRRHTGEARSRVYRAFDLLAQAVPAREPGRKLQALHVRAMPDTALSGPVLERLLALLAAKGIEVTSASLETMPWREQLRLLAGTDLIFGVHSRALAAAVWAHGDARVLEIFPRGVRRYEVQLLVEAAGLGYLGVEAAEQDGFVIRALERNGPPTGHSGGLVTELPWALLDQVLTPSPLPAAA